MAFKRESIKKFDTTIRTMVCTDKSLHDRLDKAIFEINSVKERDVTPDTRKDFIFLLDKIRAYRESGYRRDLESGLAASIFELCIELHQWTAE